MAANPRARAAPSSFKLVLLGESAVGKSSIVLRFVRNDFDDYRESTIGAAFLSQTVSLEDERLIKFEIWDTAGQERYKSLAPMYYRSARVAVVAYDITSSASLEKAKTWIRELQRQADPNIIIALAGNKADLTERREVTQEAAKQYADEENALFFETSAKSGEGVNEMFEAIARKLATMMPDEPKQARSGVNLNQQKSAADGCAC